MAISLTSPITGLAQTGLTSPTYTNVVDTPPAPNAKQWAITALGGTQTGVEAHAADLPFTFTAFKPLAFKGLGAANPSNGWYYSVPRNVYKIITRKGTVINTATGQTSPAVITTTIDLPAGCTVADPESVRAALSAHFGGLSQQSAGIGDTVTSGVL